MLISYHTSEKQEKKTGEKEETLGYELSGGERRRKKQ
jgi:hypothetical protein